MRLARLASASGNAAGWWTWADRVMARCANGHAAQLDHSIAVDGTVSPSLECPEPGCTFHEFVQLVDWDGRVVQPRAAP